VCGSTSDVPCRERVPDLSIRCPPPGPPLRDAPSRAPLPCDPRRLPPPSARSTRRPFRGDGFQREPVTDLPALPQWIRLPTLFHRLAPRGGRRLDRGRYRTLFTSGRSWPRIARRLLQPKRSASTTANLRNPDSLGRPASSGSVSRFTNPFSRARLRPMLLGLRLAIIAHVVQSLFERPAGGYPPTVRRTGAEDSRVRGRFWCSAIRRSPGRPPSRTIACLGGFAPTRWARTPHVAAARADHDGSTVIALADPLSRVA